VEFFRDLARLFAFEAKKKPTWRTDLIEILQLLRKVYTNAGKGDTRDLRLNNPLIQRLITKPPGVEPVFLRISPFTREHLVADDINEFVYRVKPNQEARFQELASAVDYIIREAETPGHRWWNNLTVLVKVILPDGQQLVGGFCEDEMVRVLRQWVLRRLPQTAPDFVLGDDEIDLDAPMAEMLIGDLNLHTKTLRIKTAGDLGRARMEETERQRREAEQARRNHLEDKAAKAQKDREEAREQEQIRKKKALDKFQEDRKTAELRALRVIREERQGNVGQVSNQNAQSAFEDKNNSPGPIAEKKNL